MSANASRKPVLTEDESPPCLKTMGSWISRTTKQPAPPAMNVIDHKSDSSSNVYESRAPPRTRTENSSHAAYPLSKRNGDAMDVAAKRTRTASTSSAFWRRGFAWRTQWITDKNKNSIASTRLLRIKTDAGIRYAREDANKDDILDCKRDGERVA